MAKRLIYDEYKVTLPLSAFKVILDSFKSCIHMQNPNRNIRVVYI